MERREDFVPRTVEDFGDGGAFPEIHVAQYPLNMGRKDPSAVAKDVRKDRTAEGLQRPEPNAEEKTAEKTKLSEQVQADRPTLAEGAQQALDQNRDFQGMAINDRFARLAEALNLAERNAREEVERRRSNMDVVTDDSEEQEEEVTHNAP